MLNVFTLPGATRRPVSSTRQPPTDPRLTHPSGLRPAPSGRIKFAPAGQIQRPLGGEPSFARFESRKQACRHRLREVAGLTEFIPRLPHRPSSGSSRLEGVPDSAGLREASFAISGSRVRAAYYLPRILDFLHRPIGRL